MSSIQEQIANIEKEIRDTPYHKATEHHIGRLRAKLSKLKDSQIEKLSKGKGGGGGYSVKKQGDATLVLVGSPSVGKSTLLNNLTNAQSKIAPYEFTTISVIPGMMEYKEANIQILDVPGLIEGAEIGRGRGKEVLSVVRGADLLLIMCDVKALKTLNSITESLENSGIRINKTPPNVTIKKKVRGGIQVISNIKQDFDKETVKEIAKEFRIANGEITLKEKLSLDELIDAFSKNKTYIPAIKVVNKIDLGKSKSKSKKYLYISAENNINVDKLKTTIWKKLNFIRVYLVKEDDKPNFENPIIMKEGQKLIDVAEKISTEFAEEKSKAKIWGKGAKFKGQEVSLQTKVVEGMQVRFI